VEIGFCFKYALYFIMNVMSDMLASHTIRNVCCVCNERMGHGVVANMWGIVQGKIYTGNNQDTL
jgi:hypothetical protein